MLERINCITKCATTEKYNEIDRRHTCTCKQKFSNKYNILNYSV